MQLKSDLKNTHKMTMNDTLASVLSNIFNAEKIGRPEITFNLSSKLILGVLKIMKEEGYVGDFSIIKNNKGNPLKINLLGNINKCNVIKPRFRYKIDELEKCEKRYLPAKDFGFIIVSTSKGLMTHIKSRELNLGGRLIAYVY